MENSVSLPSKQTNVVSSSNDTRKTAFSFLEDKNNFQKRKISEIRFDDNRFWMELNIVSYSPNNNFVQYWDEKEKKRYFLFLY